MRVPPQAPSRRRSAAEQLRSRHVAQASGRDQAPAEARVPRSSSEPSVGPSVASVPSVPAFRCRRGVVVASRRRWRTIWAERRVGNLHGRAVAADRDDDRGDPEEHDQADDRARVTARRERRTERHVSARYPSIDCASGLPCATPADSGRECLHGNRARHRHRRHRHQGRAGRHHDRQAPRRSPPHPHAPSGDPQGRGRGGRRARRGSSTGRARPVRRSPPWSSAASR